ncbi:MAG: type IV pilus modification PilV family protein [Burkholderiales bacterium]
MPFPTQAGIRQRGATLLEALIGILIFSVGILALVGMQALAIKHMSDAKYRSDASFFANEIIGQMWVNRSLNGVNQLPLYAYAGSGAPPVVIDNWVTSIQNALPGVTAAANRPIITVAGITVAGATVTVTVRWQLPGGSDVHRHITMAYING